MNRLTLLATVALWLVAPLGAQETPDGPRAEYAAPVDRVFAAALMSIQQQRYEIRSRDEIQHAVDFHVGVTALSWGYNMRLKVTPTDETHASVVIAISRTGGKIVSWGSGKKQAQKILTGIERALAEQAPAIN